MSAAAGGGGGGASATAGGDKTPSMRVFWGKAVSSVLSAVKNDTMMYLCVCVCVCLCE